MNKHEILLPALLRDGQEILSAKKLSLEHTATAERRLVDAKHVNPATYSDLEYTFNCSYRELKTNLAAVSFEIAKSKEAVENAKAEAILDHYPIFLEDKPKGYNTSDTRNAFIQRFQPYKDAVERVQQLEMLEKLLDGKIKTMERVTSHIRKQMDIVLRSGIDPKLYNK